MTSSTHQQDMNVRINRNGARLFTGIVFFMSIQIAVLFTAAGTVRWSWAWAYFGLYAVCYTLGLMWVTSVNPAVINERGRKSTNTEGFDLRFHRAMPLLIFGALVVGGLDHRFGWSSFPAILQALGLFLLIPALLLAMWVLATNAYASRVVRIQDGHQVITNGPYRIVRHPMYSGTLLSWIAAALALGSWWMLIPAALGIALFVWRTAWEDATLMEKLPGYGDFARQTRFRLIPGVW